nr:MAG TPA: hypothetical protein [Caudoviricetes sp.]
MYRESISCLRGIADRLQGVPQARSRSVQLRYSGTVRRSSGVARSRRCS